MQLQAEGFMTEIALPLSPGIIIQQSKVFLKSWDRRAPVKGGLGGTI